MKSKLIIPLLLTSVALTACSSQGAASQSTATTANSTSMTNLSNSNLYGTYSNFDQDTSYNSQTDTTIDLSSKSVTNSSDGVTIDGQTVTITKGGTYIVKGSLTNGQLKVAASNQDKVHLVFENVTITNESGPAVNVEQADKVAITLADNTTNTVTDGSNYNLANGETEPDATIYSKDDLSFNGNGTLKVNANYQNGIRSKDDLTFVSGNYQVNAVSNAIKGKDSVAIKDGTYQLSTNEGDAVQANNSEDSTKGYIAIDGGQFTIDSGRDGLQAETNLSIQNADFSIKTASGYQTTSASSSESYKGLKAGGALLISSGNFTIDSADDAIHSNDSVTITGGDLQIKTGDDGIHADNTLTIEGGQTTISNSYEGLEASVINIKDGTTSVTSTDDGVNAGGGSDTTAQNTGFSPDQFGAKGQEKGPGGGDTADSSKEINITGGTLTVNAQGDGLDSNGNIKMSGGTVIVHGTTTSGNGALDYNGNFTQTGGTLVAAGAAGMAQNISSVENQAALAIYLSNSLQPNTQLTLKDENDQVVGSYTSEKSFQHIVFSNANLIQGKTYKLYNGSTLLGSYQLTSEVNNFNQDGSTATQTSGMPGGGGMGIMRR
ncbi:carbohydrate-binding domain-containing protein [Holzapfeliella sp. JNUCC 72]